MAKRPAKQEPETRSAVVNVRLTPGEVARVDELAVEWGSKMGPASRSDVIRQCLRDALAKIDRARARSRAKKSS